MIGFENYRSSFIYLIETIIRKSEMPAFTAARTNMVDSQIHTMGVVSEPVLEAFRTVPRENFVPDDRRGIAYSDEDLTVATGRSIMEPLTHARLLQAVLPIPGDNALDIGCATGYSTAILSALCARVVAVEADAALLAHAQTCWGDATNIQAHQGPFAAGYAPGAPYSLIVINGSMESIPANLVEQMAQGGRLAAIVRTKADRIGHAILVTKNAQGAVSHRVLFDAAVPFLPGHEPHNDFIF